MANITIYNNDVAVAKTSQAFDTKIIKELMRTYTLSFSLLNNNNARQYITANSIFVAEGQAFDIAGYKTNSGSKNTTDVSAEHVSYRLNNYTLAANYTFVGTATQIAQNILNEALNTNGHAASTEFTLGTVADVGTKSFVLGNENTVTARYAIIALKTIGVEVDYDNFTINLPETCGTGNSKTFKFGTDLQDFNRTWDLQNGTTYDVEIANLQRIPGHSGDVFDVGDAVNVQDNFIGDTITKRIITYTKYLDDPSRDSITLGVFIRNTADDSLATQIAVDNSVQQGQPYSNVSIDHTNGFMAMNLAQDLKAVHNATNCFAVYKKIDGEWVLMNTLTDDGLETGKLKAIGIDEFYGVMRKGSNPTDGYGFSLIRNGTTTKDVFFAVYPYETIGGQINLDDGTQLICTATSAELQKYFDGYNRPDLFLGDDMTWLEGVYNGHTSRATLTDGAFTYSYNFTDYMIVTPTRTDINTPLYVQNVHITSDRELKENIVEAPESVLSTIETLKFYYYTYINSGADNSMNYGLMADEVPFQMTSDHKTIDIYGGIALALKGVQELIEQNKELRAQIDDYKAATEKRLADLEAITGVINTTN